MKTPVKIIHNQKSGHVYKLLRTGKETNGELLDMEVTYPAHSGKPPGHYHPYQKEYFQVISGEMTVRLNNQQQVFKAGESFEVPPNTVHSMWNERDQPTVMHWQVMPALNSEQLFETMAGLSNDGKVNRKGVPGILQIALIMLHFSREYRAAKPSFFIQQLIFRLLAPVAYLLGYKAVYPKYFS